MKIISKFKDYYDNIQGIMFDSDMLFIRKNRIEEITLSTRLSNSFSGTTNVHYMGFCGKIYPFIIFKNVSCMQIDDFKKYMMDNNKKLVKCHTIYNDYDSVIEYDIGVGLRHTMHSYSNFKSEKNRMMSSIDKMSKEIESLNLFDKYETPYFLYTHERENNLHVCPILADYNFQEIMDPYTTYQELVMYLGNKAINEYPPQITDNVVIRDSKGFDKWSFKTMPTKHKK